MQGAYPFHKKTEWPPIANCVWKRYQFEGEVAKELGCSFSAVVNFVNKWSVWIPYDLPPQNTQDRIEVAKILDGDQKPLVSRLGKVS